MELVAGTARLGGGKTYWYLMADGWYFETDTEEVWSKAITVWVVAGHHVELLPPVEFRPGIQEWGV